MCVTHLHTGSLHRSHACIWDHCTCQTCTLDDSHVKACHTPVHRMVMSHCTRHTPVHRTVTCHFTCHTPLPSLQQAHTCPGMGTHVQGVSLHVTCTHTRIPMPGHACNPPHPRLSPVPGKGRGGAGVGEGQEWTHGKSFGWKFLSPPLPHCSSMAPLYGAGPAPTTLGPPPCVSPNPVSPRLSPRFSPQPS